MIISVLVSILSCFFEAILIFMVFDAYDIGERVNLFGSFRYIYGITLLSVLIVLSNEFLNLGLMNLIFVILAIFLILFMYSKNIKINLAVAIISVVMLTISEILITFLITLLLSVTIEQVATIDDYRILGTILSKLLAFGIFKAICIRHNVNNDFSTKTSYWVLFLIMIIASGLSIFVIFKLQYESHLQIMNIISILCAFGLLYTTFFALYLYEKISKQAIAEKNQEIFKEQIKVQSRYFNDISFTWTELRKLRHDLANHCIALQAYFENNQNSAGIDYIRNLNNLITVSKNKFETGNIAFDAIINTKQNIALTKNIKFTADIQIPEKLFLDDIDICIIFGNALDNCIEACERLGNVQKEIKLSLVYADDSLMCKICNTALKPGKTFLKSIKGDFENHGYGIKNIKSALNKYESIYEFKQTDNEFIFKFTVFK